MLFVMNDPDIVAWLESDEGCLWVKRNFHISIGAAHFFSFKANIETCQRSMHWTPDEGEFFDFTTEQRWKLEVAPDEMPGHP
jgi:hypothetical protein